MKRALLTCVLLLNVSGCSWIGRQADSLGEHMPVIGERCEHWQCLTESGRQTSDMHKSQKEAQPQETAQPTAQQPVANDPYQYPQPAPYPQQ